MLQQREEFGRSAGRIAGSFIAFLFPLRWFHFRETVFRGKIAGVILPDAGKEIINLCYLVILAAMPPIRILSYPIS